MFLKGWVREIELLDRAHDRRFTGARITDHQQVSDGVPAEMLEDRDRDIAERVVLPDHTRAHERVEVGWLEAHTSMIAFLPF